MRIVSFGQMTPSAANTSAGGQFYFEHVRALRELGHDVRTVTPTSPFDLSADVRDDPGSVRVSPSRSGSSLLWRQVDRLSMGGVPRDYRTAVLTNASVQIAVRRAELIEYQWVEQMSLVRSVERLRDVAGPSFGVVHDELIQREARHLAASRVVRRPVRALDLAQVHIRERASFRSILRLLTLSLKDAERCDRIAARAISRVVTPPVVSATRLGDRVDRGYGSSFNVLMVGAMSRAENEHGAVWLIEQVWPSVRRQVPRATLVIAGANPPATVERAAQRADGVHVTGYVAELDPLYQRADVVVVPLFAGAGVKFKTIVGLAHDLPVVATSIGAEGVLEGVADVFASVTNDPAEFASAIVRVANEPQHQAARSAQVGRLVRRVYGKEGYAARLAPLLEELQIDYSRRFATARPRQAG